MRGTKRADGVIEITEAEYNAMSTDFASVWTTERWDIPNWAEIREQHIGKRTMLHYVEGKGTCLIIEGMGLEIVG